MILSMPFPGSSSKSKGTVQGENVSLWKSSSLQESPGEKGRSDQTAENGQGEPAVRTAAAKPAADYEKELEERIAQILKSVEGVGKVDVMVVLSSSGEKVYRTDRSENTSTTKEKDASGGERDIASSQSEENTILSQQSGSTGTSPLIQKELYPEISGIVISAQGEPAVRTAAAKPAADYEKELEERIAQILKSVEGVGKVDVMVVLSSSGEKVYRTDRSENTSTTKEKDASGGERDIASSQSEENTILSQQSGSTGTSPLIQKELYPEISGIVISAQGGDSPTVQAEISQAMEALFGLAPNKVKVLKRAE